jgi:hypothetical protein
MDTLERGDSTLSASDYLDVFKDKNVSTIIRLNSTQYSAAVFKRAGFQHFDLPFEDCGVPSDRIVDKFLRIAEEAPGVVAVHCLAGLGRTGTLIALYLMKHHGFTAREVMGWIRICRPGSIIGPQQHYLEQQQSRMHMLGVKGCAGLGDLDVRARVADGQKSFWRAELEMDSIKEEKSPKRKNGSVSRTSGREEVLRDAASDCSFLSEAGTGVQPDSDMIARMVTQGMLRRDCRRLACLSRSNTWDESVRPGAASDALVSEPFQDKSQSKRHRKQSSQAHAPKVRRANYETRRARTAERGTTELSTERGTAVESFSDTIRSILDPEHLKCAERLMAQVRQEPYKLGAHKVGLHKLPPVEWGSYVRSVHFVCVCV